LSLHSFGVHPPDRTATNGASSGLALGQISDFGT
jgi:hypothetical protein